MNRISQFFSGLFAASPRLPALPKDEHVSIPAPEALTFHHPKHTKQRRAEKPTSFGTFQRIKPICGHRVTPLNRHQKRDLSKFYGEKIL